MIPVPSGVKVWIATGHTDMRRGMQGLALQVQESLKRGPHAGDLYIFRGRRGDLAKILWHDGIGLSLYAKRLDRGKFIWPSASSGAVSRGAKHQDFVLDPGSNLATKRAPLQSSTGVSSTKCLAHTIASSSLSHTKLRYRLTLPDLSIVTVR